MAYDSKPSVKTSMPPRIIGLISGISIIPIILLFAYLGKKETGVAEASVVGVLLYSIIALRNDLRGHFLTNISVFAIAFFEFVAILFIKIPHFQFIIAALFPFSIINFIIMVSAIYYFNKLFYGYVRSDG